jgi:hypothetical protein
MWFLGYGLDDTVPDHSVLSKARKRWGQEVFVALFSRVVAQCVRAGLVEGTKIHADSSLVDANASLNSVGELDAATLDQIRRACRQQTEKLDEADSKKDEADDDQDPSIPEPSPRTEINQKYQSNTDPEATLVRQPLWNLVRFLLGNLGSIPLRLVRFVGRNLGLPKDPSHWCSISPRPLSVSTVDEGLLDPRHHHVA